MEQRFPPDARHVRKMRHMKSPKRRPDPEISESLARIEILLKRFATHAKSLFFLGFSVKVRKSVVKRPANAKSWRQ